MLGQRLRDLYLNPSSPSSIRGIDHTIVDNAQLRVRADGGGEGGVIFSSAVSLLQGLFPPSSMYNMTLANGTMIVGPMGGYQAIPSEQYPRSLPSRSEHSRPKSSQSSREMMYL